MDIVDHISADGVNPGKWCARIGLVTSQGLTGTLKTNYPKPVLYLMVLFSFPAIVMNIGADIAGMERSVIYCSHLLTRFSSASLLLLFF
ncbi:MAG: hypothetical protein WDO19_05205 [Bacteroidota bacterium]